MRLLLTLSVAAVLATPATASACFSDPLNGQAGPLDGRVSPTGQVWDDFNGALRLDGHGGVIRSPDAVDGVSGSYGQINLDNPVRRMSADVSWTGQSRSVRENGAVVLIYGPRDDHGPAPAPQRPIFRDAVHVVFGPWLTVATIYTNGKLRKDVWAWRYDRRLRTDGHIYRVALRRSGDTLTIRTPDGKRHVIRNRLIGGYAGPYTIWQAYDAVSPRLTPRLESAAAC